jgi:virginiamycin B lyase
MRRSVDASGRRFPYVRLVARLRTGGRPIWWLVPTLLVLGLAVAPRAHAHIYWGNYDDGGGFGTTVGRANLDGSGANDGFITGAGGPAGVAVDSAHIYWGNYDPNTIGRANLDGSGVNQSFIAAGSPHGMAVDGAHIYWSDAGTEIGRANLDGSGVNESFITGGNSAYGVAVDGAHVYWTSYNNGTIGRANLDGSGVNQSFISGASGPYEVAVDGAHVFWVNYNNGTIGRANLDGSGVNQSFITGASFPGGVAVDAAHLYWTNTGSKSIGRANLDGSGVNQSFITGTTGPLGVAVTPLETTITEGPSGTVSATSASFSFVGSEPGGFECRLDGGSFATCNSPATYSGLATGAHSFGVRATDAAGNVDPTPAERSWTIATLTSPAVALLVDVTPPSLTDYRLSRSVFAAASRGGSVRESRARVGTRVRYRLSEPATVPFTVERAAPGRRVGGRCVRPTRRNRTARPCIRYLKLRGSFSRQSAAGLNRFTFTGRLRGRRLSPGRYRLVARARDGGGNWSQAKRVRFRIVRR